MLTMQKRTPVTLSIMLALILTLLLSAPAFAEDGTEPMPITTGEELIAAVAAAEDGGTITINDAIYLDEGVELGSAEKAITLKRGTGNAFIEFAHGDGTAITTVRNIIFDGDNKSDNTNGSGFVSVGQNMVFENCQFENNARSCAVQVMEANISVEFNDCTFDNNYNAWGDGGHISITNSANVTLNRCRLENGSASNNGGAIGMGASESSYCTMNDCVITGNEAGELGGGIYAVSSFNHLYIVNSQIYHNKAAQGADIAAGYETELEITGNQNSIVPEYQEQELTPLGWIADYGILPEGDFGSYIGNTNLILLKMAFEEKEPDPIIITETVTVEKPVYITDTKTKVVEKIVEVPAEEKRKPVTLQCGEVILDKEHPVELQGYGDGNLGLEDLVTRAQVAQILYRQMESGAEHSNYGSFFPDVTENAWFYDAVITMADSGVVAGSDDGQFHPDDPVTWAQMITMLYRFTDCEPTYRIITEHWAKDAINTAIEQGWIDYTDQFAPDAPANRGEVQSFINAVLTWAQGE